MTTVAVLGTGTMGAAMARNLLAAGFTVRAWNRTRARAEQIAGATVSTTPADAVRGADVIVTMLSDGPTVAGVMADAVPGLSAGQVWAQTSTVGIQATAELLDLAAAHGLAYVDAPVLGTRQPAEAGTLTVLAAGSPAVRLVVDPVFDAVGSRTEWLGDDPAGAAAARLKLVANTWVLALVTGTAEVLGLARGLDVEPQRFLDLVAGGPLDNAYLRAKAAAILAEDFAPNFSAANAAKDGRLILEAAAEAGVRLDATRGAVARLERATELGHGADDLAASYLAGFE
jgi:3-hydroxyisobutyrate dehydrogenase